MIWGHLEDNTYILSGIFIARVDIAEDSFIKGR